MKESHIADIGRCLEELISRSASTRNGIRNWRRERGETVDDSEYEPEAEVEVERARFDAHPIGRYSDEPEPPFIRAPLDETSQFIDSDGVMISFVTDSENPAEDDGAQTPENLPIYMPDGTVITFVQERDLS